MSGWPMGTVLTPHGFARQERADLLSMLKRANVHLASIALLDVAPEVKSVAAAFVRESQALVRRVEGTR